MYNEEFKLAYLEANETKNLNLFKYMRNAFEQIASTEETLGKDLCNFTVAEIVDYYKYLSTASFETLQVINNQFKLYTDYCIAKRLVKDNQNHYIELRPELLITCVNRGLANSAIVTREQIYRAADDCINVCDAFLLLALFEGIRGKECEEIIELYPENIDVENHILHLKSGRDLIVPTKLIDVALESANTYEYNMILGPDGRESRRSFDDNDRRVLKRKKNNRGDGDSLLNRSKAILKTWLRLKDSLGLNYNMTAIIESGRIDYIKTLMEKDGDDITLRECLSIHRAEIEERFGKIQALSTYELKYKEFF